MVIVHKISDFLFDLFPKAKEFGNSIEILKEELQAYYTFGVYKPKVSIVEDSVEIIIDVPSIINQKPEFDKATSLCDKRKFTEAKKIIEKLIDDNPTVSEYHRVLGQIYSEEGDHDEAINNLIDALKWDPKNGYALTMMGNIFAKNKNDIDTACKYFNEAIAQNPNDFIAINNLGTNLFQLGKWEEGLKYLETAYDINPNYPNTNYGIALAHDHLGNTLVAFDYAIGCLKKCGANDKNLFNHCLTFIIKISEDWIKGEAGKKVLDEYKSHLEKKCGKKIKVEVDENIPTAAKIEFAENKERDYHLIKFKTNYLAVEHLMMHELVHLDFATEAREDNTNMLFVSDGEKRKLFITDNEKTIVRLNKEGYTDESISKFMTGLFDGINVQIYNTPIDLFIEDFLYENYHELRPYQFISLFGLITEGKNAVTHEHAIKLTPKEILYASKILNLLNAIHFKDLFGYDLISGFGASPGELKEANRLYEEFNEYRHDRASGEEYEVVQHWADDLKLSKYFELADENDFRNKRSDIDGLLSSIEADPFDLESNKNVKEKEMGKFQEAAKKSGVNMAVVMFMVDAMQHFKKLSPEKIKEIALEIAMVGTQGIKPGGDNKYKLSNVPDKDFSGYHLLAYYYVSWSIAIPEMLEKINLPYDQEFQMAKTMIK